MRSSRVRRTTSGLAGRVAAVLVAGAVLTGCVGVPTSGPVQRGEPVVDEPGPIYPVSVGPAPDDSPLAIVRGFLLAGAAGFSDGFQFQVAREYLGDDARNSWDPLKQAVVYTSTLDVEEKSGGRVVQVSLVVAGEVNSGGEYMEVVPDGAPRNFDFELAKDAAGQWRISALDDGLLVVKPNFDALYRETVLYFPSTDGSQLVPDTRWLPNRNVETQAVRAILNGPADWLRDGVRTVVPTGVSLLSDSVAVVDGVAQVNLSVEERSASPQDRALLVAQLEATLERLPGAPKVEVSVGGVGLSTSETPRLERDPQPGVLWGFADGQVARLEGSPSTAVVVPGIDLSTVIQPSHLAVGYQDGPIVMVSQGRDLVYVPPDGTPPQLLFSGEKLVPPSVDRFAWVWTAESASHGEVVVKHPDGREARIRADWLDGQEVRSIRVSRDGARLVIVSGSPGTGLVTVDVVAIVRGEGGVPQGLGSGEPLRIGATLSDASSAVWVDESTVAVLGRSGAESDLGIYLVPVGGPTRLLLKAVDASALAAGRGERSVYVEMKTGELYVSNLSRWSPVTTGLHEPTFPG